MNIYHLVTQVLAFRVPGDLVELGCHDGQSSVLIQAVINAHDPSKTLHVFDSFEGLPAPAPEDSNTPHRLAKGQLKTTRDALIENFRHYNLPQPQIYPGWFDQTLPTGLPDQICFAFLDGDFYSSILVSLQYVYPRLAPGAICLIDDYSDPLVNPAGSNELPGVKKACDEYLSDKPEKVSCLYAGNMSHGFFQKI